MSRPSQPDKIDWSAAGKIIDPGASKKSSGWDPGERPPNQTFNWFWELLTRIWNFLFGAGTQYNVIINSDSDRGDYASMASYLADSPAAGDRVLIQEDEVLSATLSIPAGVELTQQKGKKFTLTANFSPIIQFANNVKTKGGLRVENSNTGTIAKGFSVNGDDNHHDNLILENASTGTVTDAVYIEASKQGNYAQARAINSGGGAITYNLTDNSGNDENHVTVKGDTLVTRSTGANKFYSPELITPTIASHVNATHDHADNAGGGLIKQLIQQQTAFDGAVATGTNVMPDDDTIPDQTVPDGDEYITRTITPTDAAHLLVIEGQLCLSNSASESVVGALFKDSIANALKTFPEAGNAATVMATVPIYHEIVAGSTSLQTFKVRAGSPVAGTTTFNGKSGARRYGGTCGSYLKVSEYKLS
jgi:hypothetical protein